MNNKKHIIALTILSACLFCALIIVVSLSPLAEMGENANKFNSIGMWLSIAMILFFYFIPLLLYAIGLRWIKIIMAIFCALGIVIFLSTIVSVVIIGIVNNNILYLTGVIIVSGLGVVVNSLWFFATFRVGRKKV